MTTFRRLRFALLKSALVVATIPAIQAQFTSGIEGTVLDPTGAVVPGATVEARNAATGESRSTQTASSGYYRLAPLAAGRFTVTVSQAGFKRSVQEGVLLEVDQIRTVNFSLEVGSTDTSVQVTAEAPPIETSEGRISGLIEQSKVEELPLTGRNFFSLVVLTPGVTGLPAGGGQSYAQATGDIFTVEYGVSLSANGQRSAGNNFTVDGATTNNVAHGGVTNFSPNAESVQEVRILANNFSADSGRNSSVIVNVLTKQGTNDFHGSMSWFHTNNKLNARSMFQNQVPAFRRNEAAASFGGPIRRNQTFFFGSFDLLRSGVATARPVRVETPEFTSFLRTNQPNRIATTLLTKYGTQINPVTNFQTAGQMLNQNCAALPSQATPITSPIGSIPCNLPVTGEVNFNATIPRDGLQWSGRIDHNFNNNKDRIYGSVYRTTLDTVLFSNAYPRPEFTRPWFQYTLYMNVSETHIFTPNILNEMGGSYTRSFGNNICDPCEIPGINVVGLEGFGLPGWSPGAFVQSIYEWRDVLSINKGTHSIKVGGNIQHNQDYDDFGRFLLRPIYNFLSVMDFASDNVFQHGQVGIDPATGAKASSAQRYIASRDGNIGLFIQDDWKLRPNVTLNLGLRWETFGNPRHRHDSTTNLIFRSGNDFSSRIADAKVDYTPNHHLLNGTDWNNFAPRFGFAWDPSRRGKMSIRGGTGVFFNRLATGAYNGVQSNPPRVAIATVNRQTPGATPVYSLGTPTEPYGFPLPQGIQAGLDEKNGLLAARAGITGVDPNLRTNYSYNWFFGVQYGMGRDWALQANYIGSSAHKLYSLYDVNRFSGDLLINNGVLQRSNRSFGGITYVQNIFNSFYSGATFAVKKRFSSGFSVDSAYTIGKVIDGGFVGGGGNEVDTRVADINDLRRERGLAIFDIPQRWTLSILYQTPSLRTGSRLVNAVLGGWQFSNVTILQSGTPFSVFCGLPFQPVRDASGAIVGNNGCDFNADGNNYDYPNAPSFADPTKSAGRQDYLRGLFQASDFPKPALGQQGNLGRSIYRNPRYFNTDLSLAKHAKIRWFIGDSADLTFRAEFYNAFNQVNLGGVVEDMGSPLFGRVTSAFPGRNIQFGIRIAF